MFYVKIDISNTEEMRRYALQHTWSGAKYRVEDMDWKQLDALFDYLDCMETEMTDTEFNDFIWFDWDDIYYEMTHSEEEDAN